MSRTRAELADHEWRATRHQAEQVDCPNCDAPAGQTCINRIALGAPTHGPTEPPKLTHLPAHHARIRKAQETKPMTTTEPDTGPAYAWTADQLETGILKALQARDMPAVVDLLKCMAPRYPDRAQAILDTFDLAKIIRPIQGLNS